MSWFLRSSETKGASLKRVVKAFLMEFAFFGWSVSRNCGGYSISFFNFGNCWWLVFALEKAVSILNESLLCTESERRTSNNVHPRLWQHFYSQFLPVNIGSSGIDVYRGSCTHNLWNEISKNNVFLNVLLPYRESYRPNVIVDDAFRVQMF